MLGKFIHPADEYLWGLTMDGGAEQEEYYPDGGGWYGLIHLDPDDKWNYCRQSKAQFNDDWNERSLLFGKVGAILHEDSQGFVSADLYRTEDELQSAWTEIEELFAEEDKED